MTLKEIAELINKSTRSIERWISSDKMSQSSDKMSQVIIKIENAKDTKKPADFTLDEVIEILRAGKISESLISLLLENAKQKENNNFVTKDDLKDFAKTLVSETIKQFMPVINNQKQIENKRERMTVKEYCTQHNIKSYNMQSFLIQVGKKCSKLSKELLRDISSKMEGDYPVSIYDVDIITHCVEMTIIENDKKNTLFL